MSGVQIPPGAPLLRIYELTQATLGTNTTESYSYDAVGNRLSSLGVSPYSYNTSNELTSTPSGSYTYDYNGNTLTDASGRSYAWDFENRLTQVTMPSSGGTATFKYDPFGRRIQKVYTTGANPPTTTTTNYLYDGDNAIETVDQNGAVLTKFAQGQNIDEPLAESVSGATYDYEQDGLGSATSLTNSSGALALTYTYDSFGKVTASSGSVSNPFRYTGRDFDSETGLYYYRARYYDPSIGRFVSEDAARFGGGTAFYEYAGDSPTGFIDPTGNCPIDLDKFVKWLDKHAYPHPTEFCAKQIRLALDAGGANTKGAPVPAKDWGPFLTNHLGFSGLPEDPAYSPLVGDISVFQPMNGSNPNGHIEAWDGTQWVSDYKQGTPLPNGTHFYPNLRKYGPQPFKIYRCN